MNKQKVPQGYSPAEDGAGSLTPFGMTVIKKETSYSTHEIRAGM